MGSTWRRGSFLHSAHVKFWEVKNLCKSGLNARWYQITKYQNVDKIFRHQTHASHFDTHRRQVGRDRVGKKCLNHQ
jgi:hypothetical protein